MVDGGFRARFAMKRPPPLSQVAVWAAAAAGAAYFGVFVKLSHSLIEDEGDLLPLDRAAALQQAFDATMKDPDYLAEVASARLDFEPMAGAELQALMESATKVSEEVLKRARAARAE